MSELTVIVLEDLLIKRDPNAETLEKKASSEYWSLKEYYEQECDFFDDGAN